MRMLQVEKGAEIDQKQHLNTAISQYYNRECNLPHENDTKQELEMRNDIYLISIYTLNAFDNTIHEEFINI